MLKEVAAMLLVGVDWAEAQHTACLLQPAGTVVRRLTIPHSAAGLVGHHDGQDATDPDSLRGLAGQRLRLDWLILASHVRDNPRSDSPISPIAFSI